MKKILSGVFILVLMGSAGLAKAGTNTEVSIPGNGKNQSTKTSAKSSGSYSFTLFNFFTESKTNIKTDSTKTSKKRMLIKSNEGVNSDL